MGSPTLAAKCGRIACIAQCFLVARAHLRKMFPEVDDESILAAVSLEDVQLTLQEFAREGIELNTSGRLASGSEPRLNLMRDFQPVRGVMGELMRTLFAQERARSCVDCVGTGSRSVWRRCGGTASSEISSTFALMLRWQQWVDRSHPSQKYIATERRRVCHGSEMETGATSLQAGQVPTLPSEIW